MNTHPDTTDVAIVEASSSLLATERDNAVDNRETLEWLFRALRRGWRRCCPHCGEGTLFQGWVRYLPRCEYCGLVYERNPGDTWAFTIVGDRLPLAAMVVIVYVGAFRSYPLIGALLFALIGVLFVWTTPKRLGVGIALHYVGRALWRDLDDPVPVGPSAIHSRQPPILSTDSSLAAVQGGELAAEPGGARLLPGDGSC
jgi:uncharacterized protein (DUF983 family)